MAAESRKKKVNLREWFLYGDVSERIYKEVKPMIKAGNDATMTILARICFLFGLAMSVMSVVGVLKPIVFRAYLFLFLTSLIFIIVRAQAKKRKTHPGYVVDYAQAACLLIYGVMNSAVYSPAPDTPGVTFCVLLMVIPFIIVDVPWRITFLPLCSTAFYLFMSHQCKPDAAFSLDVTNSVSFALVSVFCGAFFTARFIQNYADRLYIEKQRDTDALTHLQTRHAAELIIQSIVSHGRTGMFLMLDIDRFKGVNDNFGHQYGDEVLTRAAGCLSGCIGRGDVAGRYGGDEFIVFFPDAATEDAEKTAHKISESFRREFKDDRAEVTCSMGFSEVTEHKDYNQFLKESDVALYDSKKAGRNTYSIYGRERK